MNKRITRKGSSTPAKSRAKTAAAAHKDKDARLRKVLANSDSKTLASLLNDLQKGKRKVHAGLTLSSYEAGFLAAQLKTSLKPKRHRRKKIEFDHIL